MSTEQQWYASYSIGNREPVRDDFIDAIAGNVPKHETLRNVEAGWRFRKQNSGGAGGRHHPELAGDLRVGDAEHGQVVLLPGHGVAEDHRGSIGVPSIAMNAPVRSGGPA